MEVIERIDDRCNDGTYFNIRFIWHLELKTMDVYFLSNSVEPWKMKRDGRLSPHCPCSGIAINLLNFVGILSLHLSQRQTDPQGKKVEEQAGTRSEKPKDSFPFRIHVLGLFPLPNVIGTGNHFCFDNPYLFMKHNHHCHTIRACTFYDDVVKKRISPLSLDMSVQPLSFLIFHGGQSYRTYSPPLLELTLPS